MTISLLASAIIPFSIFKSIVLMLVLLGWAKWVSFLDKEAEYYYLSRRMLNLAQITAAVVAFGLWLLLPFFWIGMVLALIILIGAGASFAVIRNSKVPEKDKWVLSLDFFRIMMEKRSQEAAAKNAKLRFMVGGQFKPVPLPDEPEFQAHMAMEEILGPAFERDAQNVQLQMDANKVVVQLEIDSISYNQGAPAVNETMAMLKYIKTAAGMDAEDIRRKQTGKCRIDAGDQGNHKIKIQTAGSTRGVTMSFQIDPDKQSHVEYAKLGLVESQVNHLKSVLEDTTQVVLVASKPHNGRTTTLYSILQQHDPYMMDIHTLEKEFEMELDGVTQHQLTDEPMSKQLNSLLLRDPKIVMLSHIGDKETPAMVCKAGLDHKRIYVGLPADDAMTAMRAWAKSVGDIKLVANSLAAIISPRLVRRLCPACRQAYQPDAAALKKLNLPTEKIGQLYKASGKIVVDNKEQVCPLCHGIGYKGLSASFEVLVFNDEAKGLLKQGKLNPLRSYLRKHKMLMLQEAALAKVVSGETSISEVMRAIGSQVEE